MAIHKLRSKPGQFVRIRRRRMLSAVVLLALIVLCGSQRTSAFKIETHVWIAQQVLNDLFSKEVGKPPNTVTIQFVDPTTHALTKDYFNVQPGIVASLAAYNNAYRLGAIGPDAFPDLVGGQMTTHPGIEDHWQADNWLQWILSGAAPPLPLRDGIGGVTWKGSEPQAFAFGYLTHAASDIFAHTYVNTYAGDIFLIDRDTDPALEVEARHILIEAFIRNHNPAFTGAPGPDGASGPNIGSPDGLIGEPPKFLARRLILNASVADQYRLQTATRHLALMYDFWHKQQTLLDDIDSAQSELDAKIAELQSKIDSVKNREICTPRICVFGHCTPSTCVDVWPYYCFLDPGTCLVVKSTEATLEVLEDTSDAMAAGLREPISTWHDQVEEAVDEYIKTSGKVAQELMKGEDGHPRGELLHWVECWTPAFAGIHSAVAQSSCVPLQWLRQGYEKARQICDSLDFLGETLWVLAPPCKVQEKIEQALSEGVGTDLSAAIAGDDSLMTTLVQLQTEAGSENSLTERFSHDQSLRNLLTFSDIVARLRGDMHVPGEGPFDPQTFAPIFDAIQLSKLVLLGPGELNRLVTRAGIANTIYGDDLYAPTTPFNILFGAVRSIDGNQQWQESSIPYPRAAGHAPERNALANHIGSYGYAFANGTAGFRLWQDCEVRDQVFRQIFRGPVATGIEDPSEYGLSEILAADDPNRSSPEHPFPRGSESADITKFDTSSGTRQYVCGDVPSFSFDRRGTFIPVFLPDTTPPTLTAPADVAAQCVANAVHDVDLGAPIVSDNRDHSPVVTNDAPEAFPYGTTIVTWHAVDASGNATDQQQHVNVVDTARPVFASTPPPISIVANDPTGMIVGLTPPVATDVCDGNLTAAPTVPVGRLSIGAHTIRWQVQDRAGNAAFVEQQINVTTKPGDIDVDGDLDSDDLQILLATLDTPPIGGGTSCDLNQDGVVDADEGAVCRLIEEGQTDPRDLNRDGQIDDRDVATLVALCVRENCDTIPPDIVIRAPQPMTYLIHQSVAADYGCSDDWGIKTCVGPAVNGAPIDTGSVGAKSFVVSATDATGHTASRSVSYSVRFSACLLYDPSRAARSGSTIPLKLQLCDAAGGNQSAAAISLTALQVTKISTNITGAVVDAGNANPDSNFRYDPTLGGTGGYIFNLSTRGLSTGTYRLTFKATGDATTHDVTFAVQ